MPSRGLGIHAWESAIRITLVPHERKALSAQAGFARLDDVIRAAGLTCVRKATETPFNVVLEVKYVKYVKYLTYLTCAGTL